MLKILSIVLILYSGFTAHASTFDEIKKLAVARSAGLKAQELEAKALASESKLKGKWQNPQLMGQVGNLKSGSTQGSTVEVSLTQPIPLSDKYSLKRELAEYALKAQESQKLYFTNWVEHQAVIAAWRVAANKELYLHGVERAQRIALIQKFLQTQPRVSIRQKVELAIISSAVLQLEKMQDQKKHDLELAEGELEFWTGQKMKSADLKFEMPSEKKILMPGQGSPLMDPEIVVAENQFKSSQVDAELARKERRPDLFLGAGYREESVSPVNKFSYGIIGLNIPIWDTGSHRAEAANARKMRDEKYYEEAQRKVNIKHQKQLEKVSFHLNQVRRFPPSLLKVQEQAIREAQVGFKQGILDVNTFLQAETQTHEVMDHIYLSWMDYLESLSSLQLMRGEPLAWEIK